MRRKAVNTGGTLTAEDFGTGYRSDMSAASSISPTGPVYVTRQAHFNAAHRLHNPTKSAKWNRETFGPCNNPKWHGHNYVIEITVAGETDPDTGYVIDLGDLKVVLQERVLKHVDHRNLNEEVRWLRGVIPSAENLAIAFWRRLEAHLPAGRLHRVRLFETPRNFVDYYGPAGNAGAI